MPCSCASAKPSGCGVVVRQRAARRAVARAEQPRVERRRLAGAERQRRCGRPRGRRRRARRPRYAVAARDGGMRAAATPEPLRRRHRGLLGGGRRQRALDRVAHELVDRAGVAEAHFGLLRMHVDVDAARIDRRATAR